MCIKDSLPRTNPIHNKLKTIMLTNLEVTICLIILDIIAAPLTKSFLIISDKINLAYVKIDQKNY